MSNQDPDGKFAMISQKLGNISNVFASFSQVSEHFGHARIHSDAFGHFLTCSEAFGCIQTILQNAPQNL